MANLSDPNDALSRSGPAVERPSLADPTGLSTNFSTPPDVLDHRLSYRWQNMTVEVHSRQPNDLSHRCAVEAMVHIGLKSWSRISPKDLGDRVTELVAALARNSGGVSGLLEVLSFENGPEVATSKVVAEFGSVRNGSREKDDANQVVSIDQALPGCGIVPGEVLWVTSPREFRVFVTVDRLQDLPEIWREIASRLRLTEA